MTNFLGILADRTLRGLDRSASASAGFLELAPIADDDERPAPKGAELLGLTCFSLGSVGIERFVEARGTEPIPLNTYFVFLGPGYVWPDFHDFEHRRLTWEATDIDVPRDIILCLHSEPSSAVTVWTAEDSIEPKGSDITEASPFEELAGRTDPRLQIRSLIESVREEKTRPDWTAIADRVHKLVELAEEEDDTDLASLGSLHGLITFLRSELGLKQPDIVLTPSGNFRAVWRETNDRHLGIEFLPSLECRFVVFAQDPRNAGRTIRTSGVAHIESVTAVIAPLEITRWAGA